MIRKTCIAMLISALFISLLSVQPALALKPSLALKYKLEFRAEATGMFVMIEGLPGSEPEGPPPVVAFGVGEAKLDGDASVSQTGGNWYFDFPAKIKMDGEIRGEMYMIEFVDGVPEITGTYNVELEFWNLESAGGMFSPDENVLFVSAEMDLTPPLEVTCLGYKLELENVESDEELKTSGEGYLLIAGLIEMGEAGKHEALIMIIEIEGELFTLVFSEQPELESIVEVEVKLDV